MHIHRYKVCISLFSFFLSFSFDFSFSFSLFSFSKQNVSCHHDLPSYLRIMRTMDACTQCRFLCFLSVYNVSHHHFRKTVLEVECIHHSGLLTLIQSSCGKIMTLLTLNQSIIIGQLSSWPFSTSKNIPIFFNPFSHFPHCNFIYHFINKHLPHPFVLHVFDRLLIFKDFSTHYFIQITKCHSGLVSSQLIRICFFNVT